MAHSIWVTGGEFNKSTVFKGVIGWLGGNHKGIDNAVLWDLLEQGPSPLLGLKWCGTEALSEPTKELHGAESL